MIQIATKYIIIYKSLWADQKGKNIIEKGFPSNFLTMHKLKIFFTKILPFLRLEEMEIIHEFILKLISENKN